MFHIIDLIGYIEKLSTSNVIGNAELLQKTITNEKLGWYSECYAQSCCYCD